MANTSSAQRFSYYAKNNISFVIIKWKRSSANNKTFLAININNF